MNRNPPLNSKKMATDKIPIVKFNGNGNTLETFIRGVEDYAVYKDKVEEPDAGGGIDDRGDLLMETKYVNLGPCQIQLLSRCRPWRRQQARGERSWLACPCRSASAEPRAHHQKPSSAAKSMHTTGVNA